MDFVKMEGLGNDFVVIDDQEPSTEEIRAWCDRRTGIGADGVLRVSAPQNGDASIRMQYWNSDGSAAEMCGNGLRCVARYGFDRGMTNNAEFAVETVVGLNRASVLEDGQVRVELGAFEVGESLTIGGVDYIGASVGNPHVVTFVSDPESAPVTTVGPEIEHHRAFPDRVNVEFAAIDGDGLRLRVWERGAGETRACGTGAAAAVAVAAAKGSIAPSANVDLPGGRLFVELIDGVAWITGPANVSFSGHLDR